MGDEGKQISVWTDTAGEVNMAVTAIKHQLLGKYNKSCEFLLL